MSNTQCPHCGKETLTTLQRFKASHWANVTCSACSGRAGMQPILLAVLYFAHTWNVFFFGFMAIYDKSAYYFATMVIGWLLLEFFALYIPFVRLRPKSSQGTKQING